MAEWKQMKMAGREWQRHFDRAIRKSWIRALAELITNSDDSYTRLGRKGRPASGDIVVEFTRDRSQGGFRVTDAAEGMAARKVESVFGEYGGEVAAGPDARGFFNRGAKDALLAMEQGREDTIKDDEHTSVELRIASDGTPQIRVNGPKPVTGALRKRLGISQNGTTAVFRIPAGHGHIPQFETVRGALAKFWMLRKIVDPANTNRRLVLRFRGHDVEISEPPPVGKEVLDCRFDVSVEGSPAFPVHMIVKRADDDLDQSPNSDQRVGGLLVVDEGDAVLDLTLGRFDREWAAARLFGSVKIEKGFKTFLRSEEKQGRIVLSEERNGFEGSHAWVQAFIREIEQRLDPIVAAERRERTASDPKLTDSEMQQQRKVMEELNKILEAETRQNWEGPNEADRKIPPPSGLAIKPTPIRLTEGTVRYAAVLIDPARVPVGNLVYVEDESGSITIEPNEIKVEKEDEPVFIRPVRITGGTSGQKGKIVAISNECYAECEYEVVEAAYPEIPGEMAFIPDGVAIVNQKTSYLSLYVKTSTVTPGETIEVESSDPGSVALLAPVSVDPRDVRNGIGKARVRVRGMGVGQKATVTARYGELSAQMQVRVRDQQRAPVDHKGLFRGISYSDSAPNQQRVHFDETTGKIVVHLREPTVTRHLGAEGEYKYTLNAKTLVAELVTQCFAQEVANRRLMSGARPYFSSTAEGRLREDLQEIGHLVYKYGPQIHGLILDPAEIRAARGEGPLVLASAAS